MSDLDQDLLQAAERGDASLVIVALDAGADIDADSIEGSLLHHAAANGHAEVCRLLLDRGARLNTLDANSDRTPLHYAAGAGHADICRLLVARGADINERDCIACAPLHLAAEHGSAESCRALIDLGADLNAKGYGDKTPLHQATAEGHAETCLLLLEKGADPNALDGYGKTAQEIAKGGAAALLRAAAERKAIESEIARSAIPAAQPKARASGRSL